MTRFEQAIPAESKMDQGQEHSTSAAFAEVRLSSLPSARVENQSSAMPTGMAPSAELIAELQGTRIIKLPRGPVDENATFPDRVAKPGEGAGRPGAYDPDAGRYGGLEASADVITGRGGPTEAELRRMNETMNNPKYNGSSLVEKQLWDKKV